MNKEKLLYIIHNNNESEIIDFKTNLDDTGAICRYVSALGNSALALSYSHAYLIWGVEDLSKKIIGTTFDPYTSKVRILPKDNDHQKIKNSNYPLINYIETNTHPNINLEWFVDNNIEGKRVVALIIEVTNVNQPIRYKQEAFIRSGTSVKPLVNFPEKERKIWKSFESSKFELEFAKTGVSFEDVKKILDLNFYKQHTKDGFMNNEELVRNLVVDKILVESDYLYNITNVGAYTLARNMDDFPDLKSRTVRITKYQGNYKTDNATFDMIGNKGIAVGFNNMVANIMNHMPFMEKYENGIREDVYKFPMIAVRELLANALVHQDFTVGGMRPMVEIFDNRIVISNPGVPLIDTMRFLDFPPKSRNDELANLLGRLNIVESRGTGIDKVVSTLEVNDLPAIEIVRKGNEATQITMREKKSFQDMSITEKNESIYWNSCLQYVNDEQINNASLRERFNLTKNESSAISKAINNATEANLIKMYDANAGKKFVSYIPFWGLSVQDKN